MSFFISIVDFFKWVKGHFYQVLPFTVAITLIIGTVFYHRFEGWNLLDSLYFSVITLTTVGYGDFSPHTNIGKIFTIFYLFVGLGIILSFINEIAKHQIKTSPMNKLLFNNRKSEESYNVDFGIKNFSDKNRFKKF